MSWRHGIWKAERMFYLPPRYVASPKYGPKGSAVIITVVSLLLDNQWDPMTQESVLNCFMVRISLYDDLYYCLISVFNSAFEFKK